MIKMISTDRKLYPLLTWESIETAQADTGIRYLSAKTKNGNYTVIPGTRDYIMRLDTYRSFCQEIEQEDMSYEASDGTAYYADLRKEQEHDDYWAALLADVDHQLGSS